MGDITIPNLSLFVVWTTLLFSGFRKLLLYNDLHNPLYPMLLYIPYMQRLRTDTISEGWVCKLFEK